MDNLIVKMFDESGMSIQEFANRAGLKYTTAHDIVTGKANPENIGTRTFKKIANVFNTTMDALSANMVDESQPPAQPPALTPDEERLLELFRSMDKSDRAVLFQTAARFATFAGVGQERRGRAAERAVR